MRAFEIENRFTYHPLQPGQPEKYREIRTGAKRLAHLIARAAPEGREQSLAISRIEEAVMWATAAIARDGTFPIGGNNISAEFIDEVGTIPREAYNRLCSKDGDEPA